MASSRTIAIAVDVEMAVAYGIRFAVTQSHAVVTTDWVPNQFLIYAYDTTAKCFIYANHDYAKEREPPSIRTSGTSLYVAGNGSTVGRKRMMMPESSRCLQDQDGTCRTCNWVKGAWMEGAFILESYNREFCKDQLEHANANIGTYSILRTWQLHGSRKAMPRTRNDPRGNEKFLTSRWLTVRQHDVEPHPIDQPRLKRTFEVILFFEVINNLKGVII